MKNVGFLIDKRLLGFFFLLHLRDGEDGVALHLSVELMHTEATQRG